MFICLNYPVWVFFLAEDEFKAFLGVMEDKEFAQKYPELHKLRQGQAKKKKQKEESQVFRFLATVPSTTSVLRGR